MVTLKSGVNELTLALAGKTVGDVRAEYGNILAIPAGAKSFVAGREASGDFVLEEGDEVVFQPATAEKG